MDVLHVARLVTVVAKRSGDGYRFLLAFKYKQQNGKMENTRCMLLVEVDTPGI